MAGKPKQRALAARVEQAGGDEVILDRIANGEYVTEIAKSWDVSPSMIYFWLHESEAREQAWKTAKEISAHSHMEGGLERLTRLADMGAGVTAAQVSAEKALAEYRMRLAAARNRAEYGDKAQTEVHFNFGDSYLAQLKELGHHDQQALPEPIQEADFELLEEKNG
jgi:hypothetical protein